MRIKAIVAYDGSAFYGFQRQKSTDKTVAGTLEKRLAQLGIETTIIGSGRTDRGVHATGQCIHFDIKERAYDLERLRFEINRYDPALQIRKITQVNENFHARFDAKRRSYRYLIKTKPLLPFERNYCAFYPDIDLNTLREVLESFEGKHDFIYFHKTGSNPKHTVRTIFRATVTRHRSYTIIHFSANGFLRTQVRLMVEAALQCTQGKLDKAALLSQLQGKERSIVKPAPAQGLYLSHIFY